MSNSEVKTAAARFLDEHPELRRAMRESKVFEAIKKRAALDIRGKRLYIVKGDVLGGEDDLFLDALAKGARESLADEPSRHLFLELSEEQRKLLVERFKI